MGLFRQVGGDLHGRRVADLPRCAVAVSDLGDAPQGPQQLATWCGCQLRCSSSRSGGKHGLAICRCPMALVVLAGAVRHVAVARSGVDPPTGEGQSCSPGVRLFGLGGARGSVLAGAVAQRADCGGPLVCVGWRLVEPLGHRDA